MALGRMDQYLRLFYDHDIEAGILTPEDVEDLIACAFIKIVEYGFGDTVNICIGGVTPEGDEGNNDLSYVILHAVRDCYVPRAESVGASSRGRASVRRGIPHLRHG